METHSKLKHYAGSEQVNNRHTNTHAHTHTYIHTNNYTTLHLSLVYPFINLNACVLCIYVYVHTYTPLTNIYV